MFDILDSVLVEAADISDHHPQAAVLFGRSEPLLDDLREIGATSFASKKN
jgi:hypothetical protein